jgi:hypothetical protein
MADEKKKQSTTEWAQQNLAGSFGDAAEAGARLALAAQNCHLVGGASVCPLIEGHEIVISVVPIERADCYPANPNAKNEDGGTATRADSPPARWGVGGATLMQLAAAAAIEWTDVQRIDDGRHPFFVHYRVHGRYPMVDGTWRPIEGERDSDFRDGSAQLNAKTEKQIPQLRETILRSTITKAKLRAIRTALGIRHGLLTEELAKPFVFSRVVFTGRSSDPQIRRMFAAVIAQRQLAATNALFGVGAQPALMGANPIGLLAAAATPVNGELVDDDTGEVTPAPRSAPPIPAAPEYTPPPAAPKPAARPQGGNGGGISFPFGRDKGIPIPQLSDESIGWYSRAMSQAIADPEKARWRGRNEQLLAALLAEEKRRAEAKAAPAPAPAAAPPPPESHPNDAGFPDEKDL